MGGLKKSMIISFENAYGRKMTPKQWDEFDSIFIDYQDTIGKYFYE